MKGKFQVSFQLLVKNVQAGWNESEGGAEVSGQPSKKAVDNQAGEYHNLIGQR